MLITDVKRVKREALKVRLSAGSKLDRLLDIRNAIRDDNLRDIKRIDSDIEEVRGVLDWALSIENYPFE